MPLPPVPVELGGELDVDGRGRLVWGGGREPKELPAEWVLRQLADANLEDDATVAALLTQYGLITSPYFDPGGVPPDREERLAPPPSLTEQRSGNWWRARNDGTLEDARWWLKTARALAGVWREASLDGDPSSAWSAEQLYGATGWACWPHFALALGAGLEPFRARVEHRAELLGGNTFTYGSPRIDLYSAACRQVFNLVVEGSTARRCENATCGRVFVHQLGGAKYRQHRSTGLRFCSPTCARAEASRQYRRRKAAEKEGQ